MGNALLERLTSERITQVEFVGQLLERVEAESRDLVDAEQSNIVAARQRITELDAQLEPLREFEALRAAGQQLSRTVDRPGGRGGPQPHGPTSGESLGDIFTRSAEYADYQRSPRGTSGRVDVDLSLMMRAPLTTVSGTGAPWQVPDRIAIAAPTSQTPLLDVVGRVRVSSSSVEWITYPAAASLAAVVPEGTQKPEATLTASIVSVNLSTIAHYVEATRQLLEDSPAARDFIDQELRRGVLDKIESLIAASVIATTSPTASGATLLGAIRAGVGAVQSAGFQPSRVLLNPADYADLDISVMGVAGVRPDVGTSFWGLVPVAVGAIPPGTAYVGDMGSAVTFLERTGVQVFVTDSHSGNFTKNIFTFVGEARGAAVVTRPEAMAVCTATAGTQTMGARTTR